MYQIIKRRNLDMEFEALLHDKKLNVPKPVEREQKKVEVSEKQESAIERAQKEAQERIGKRYGGR